MLLLSSSAVSSNGHVCVTVWEGERGGGGGTKVSDTNVQPVHFVYAHPLSSVQQCSFPRDLVVRISHTFIHCPLRHSAKVSRHSYISHFLVPVIICSSTSFRSLSLFVEKVLYKYRKLLLLGCRVVVVIVQPRSLNDLRAKLCMTSQ